MPIKSFGFVDSEVDPLAVAEDNAVEVASAFAVVAVLDILKEDLDQVRRQVACQALSVAAEADADHLRVHIPEAAAPDQENIHDGVGIGHIQVEEAERPLLAVHVEVVAVVEEVAEELNHVLGEGEHPLHWKALGQGHEVRQVQDD